MKPASKRTGSECATSSSTPRHLRLSLSQVFGRAKAAESRTESGSSLPPSYGSYAVRYRSIYRGFMFSAEHCHAHWSRDGSS
ncbi:uncharacterized protein FFB20_10537 [Fusarium fujikuroi]|nr:uncharacterized protein FFC1_04066 [Fusarium fujikuroi]SCN97875.1 uncharacterized protein FFB20_10537 [Fusarium fujikuroi]SCO17798.1 uncharacterized protein FFE2_13926 [Fusarium fujikuroi]SCO26954.1 uncharacterized protein FFM5_15223 [Fusarium fujikuroi]SCO50071.1 uncharacterized protein FFMR_10051 [Fusarium fujikuroi]